MLIEWTSGTHSAFQTTLMKLILMVFTHARAHIHINIRTRVASSSTLPRICRLRRLPCGRAWLATAETCANILTTSMAHECVLLQSVHDVCMIVLPLTVVILCACALSYYFSLTPAISRRVFLCFHRSAITVLKVCPTPYLAKAPTTLCQSCLARTLLQSHHAFASSCTCVACTAYSNT